MVGSPNAMLSTTFAVLRPTPGSASSASRVRGTCPPCSATSLSRQRDHVLRLGAEEPDGLDQVAHALLAERDHLLRRVGEREQRGRRLVDAGIGRLRRQHHRHQQRERIDVLQFALRLRIGGLEAAERFLDLAHWSRAWQRQASTACDCGLAGLRLARPLRGLRRLLALTRFCGSIFSP